MILLLIPVTLVALVGLLALTEVLDRRSSEAMVRMALRSRRATPEATETIVTAELSRRLRAAGVASRPSVPVTPEATPAT